MRLGEWIKDYRTRHSMSLQDMANVCGLSKAYIAMLEKGTNPTTNKPVSPTMQAFEKIAVATGQDVDSLLKILDGERPITLNSSGEKFSDDERNLVYSYRDLNRDGRNLLFEILNSLCVTHSAQRMTSTV